MSEPDPDTGDDPPEDPDGGGSSSTDEGPGSVDGGPESVDGGPESATERAEPEGQAPSGTRTAGPGVGALEDGWASDRDEGADAGVEPAPDVGEMAAELREIREQLDSFETDVDDRTVHRDEIESELRRYVRWKLRRGHARGWGPYLVLLYGTAMTLGAFFYLQGLWSILAMVVVWTSTLGVYVLMVLAGAGFNLIGLPMWALDKVGRWRGN